MTADAAVEFRNVDIIFGDRPKEALRLLDEGRTRAEIQASCGQVLGVAGASLQVQEGEICVLMGLSGSGKSTLLRAVNGLNKVTRGEVLVRHGGRMVDVASADPDTLRGVRTKSVAMVFQQFALLPWRTVAENVGFGLELRGVPRAERDRIVAEKLKMVALDAWADRYADELSGGMQQRVGLARAFATDADILLMDEPFSALDPLIRTKLQDELLDLQRNLKKTILFVSHDLDEALKLGRHIAIMESGRIVQFGAPEDIVLRPADDYVREFVAHVNPLSVLTAYNVMRDSRDLETAGDGWVWLDRRRTTRFRIDGDRKVTAAERDGAPARWQDCLGHPEAWAKDAPLAFWARQDTPLRDVMVAMQHNAAPVAVFDAADRFVGAIGVRDALAGVLRRSEAE
ncbi:choline ABC transporter ATP-binding protein [Alsobacter soli]|uniref:Trimethylamine N-oxide transport system ATP-binding protein TmoW n=1 Tax=Alsobacter soli TaxID=2109933 RepID=A0A2T1HYZ1_9HYPH|nr:choline ABC transporter ATP-binding protein [Alsobacter soli]PSC06907.1 choline ABC transporter ATP-binding protein [Alsobacter soli]